MSTAPRVVTDATTKPETAPVIIPSAQVKSPPPPPHRPWLSRLQDVATRRRTRPRQDRDPGLAARDAERLATYPTPYPNGWYMVAGSDEVGPKTVKNVAALGEQIVLFRDHTGHARAVSAVCPHLGANLGDGKVRDGCLECPFHGWRFAGDGAVAAIPYQPKLPRIRARTFPIREMHGMIFLYRAHDGSEAAGAPYALPIFDELDSGRLRYRGRYDGGVVGMHIADFAENAADFAHFLPLHGRMTLPFTQIEVPLVEIVHAPTWDADLEQPHVAWFRNTIHLSALGRRLPRTDARAEIAFLGPGSVTTFRFMVPEAGDILLFHLHTPVAPLRQKVEFRWFAEDRVPWLLLQYVVGSWVSQWAADIRIWEAKSYAARPALVGGDGPVHRMRRWYRQFHEPGFGQPEGGGA